MQMVSWTLRGAWNGEKTGPFHLRSVKGVVVLQPSQGRICVKWLM